jgi:hypothetical protein
MNLRKALEGGRVSDSLQADLVCGYKSDSAGRLVLESKLGMRAWVTHAAHDFAPKCTKAARWRAERLWLDPRTKAPA